MNFPDRRSFLRTGATGLLGALQVGLHAQIQPLVTVPPYLADVDGDGILGVKDIDLVRQALFTSRGFGLEPSEGFDYRADVFSAARVDQDALDAVSRTIDLLGYGVPVSDPRPITVAWHYGWHDIVNRPILLQTGRYLGGDYISSDATVEEEFNRLKNEFGITVDALSWIPPRVRPSLLPNYENGYFSASNSGTRYVALLYENMLALPTVGGRNDFRSLEVGPLLVSDFEAMARTLVDVRDRYPSRVFQLSGRPVIFIFGSHSWGLNEDDEMELLEIVVSVGAAREAFRAVYGAYPYLVGEDLLPIAATKRPSPGRVHRAMNFDALYSYHAANFKPNAPAFAINEAYGILQQRRLIRAAESIREVRNRFTGRPLLIIPSLAGGFAKHGMPTLSATRRTYADYLKLLIRHHAGTYISQEWSEAIGTAVLPAPIYTVGSWNEEFEGHAVFPAQFNLTFDVTEYRGFDFVMALKEVFGWNHYSKRVILGS